MILSLFLSSASGLLILAVLIYLKKYGFINSLKLIMIRFFNPLLDIRDYNVCVLDKEEECEAFCERKIKEKVKFIGFDCEWISNGVQDHHYPVALLQMAFLNKECALIRLDKIGKITASLSKLLSDRSYLMVGVGVLNDTARLLQGFNVSSVGCVDIRNVALRCGIRSNLSLAGLTNKVLGCRLNKQITITCSNWESAKLTQEQINYAASDAIAGLLIFKNLVLKKLVHQKRNIVDLNDDIQSEEGTLCAMSLCQGVIDIDFKDSLARKESKLASHFTHGPLKPKRTSAYNVRQTPLYYNCQLLAPDGTLLSTVDMKKVEWYINKGLGDLISQDPPTLKLKFEPAGKPNKDREYYLTKKENICVVCGRSDGYIRKNIIPHEYRKHFPLKMKKHLSHDVLLLCVDCHQVSSHHDGFLRQQIAWEYSAPLNSNTTQRYHEDFDKVRVRSLARAMIEKESFLPESRTIEILQALGNYLNCQPSEITSEMMKELSKIETKSLNTDYMSHGEVVVRAVTEKGVLGEFQSRWRQHFLDTMKPRYMPRLWNVNHNPI